MANPHKGDVRLLAREAAYTIRLNTDAICQAEGVSGKRFAQLVVEADTGGFSSMRLLLWAALRKHHPALDLAGAGEIIDAAGVKVVTDGIAEAIKRAFPPADENPPKPGQDGTGPASSPDGSNSV